ncbi:hypothetical protein TDB9533_04276 [Thalassocella blandensis]|nr:hypothetical protein TDB9533_04276 [Thalassocella blandensis]
MSLLARRTVLANLIADFFTLNTFKCAAVQSLGDNTQFVTCHLVYFYLHISVPNDSFPKKCEEVHVFRALALYFWPNYFIDEFFIVQTINGAESFTANFYQLSVLKFLPLLKFAYKAIKSINMGSNMRISTRFTRLPARFSRIYASPP